MRKLNYSELVRDILARHAEQCSNRQTELRLIFDIERDRYQVLNLSWHELKRIFGCLIYIEVKEGKFGLSGMEQRLVLYES